MLTPLFIAYILHPFGYFVNMFIIILYLKGYIMTYEEKILHTNVCRKLGYMLGKLLEELAFQYSFEQIVDVSAR